MVAWIDYLRGLVYGWITAEEVTQGLRLDHLTVIITGATSGIGEETARVLAMRGAHVVIGARSVKRGRAVKERIESNYDKSTSNRGSADTSGGGGCNVTVLELDLSSMASVARFAARFLGLGLPLNVLVNNAGVCCKAFERSEDGLEMNFATNHIGHFLLTELVLERMVDTAKSSGIEGRIVNVSSCLHTWASSSGIPFDKLVSTTGDQRSSYVDRISYAHSKLANILHAKELAKRLKERGCAVTANALHPGVVKTNITRDHGLIIDAILRVASMFMKTVPQAAATVCYVAADPKVAGVTGKYFADCNEAPCSASANDEAQARKLWDFSERITCDHRRPNNNSAQQLQQQMMMMISSINSTSSFTALMAEALTIMTNYPSSNSGMMICR